MSDKLFVAYYRVSTRKQGESGLGLEAQRDAVAHHVARHGQLIDEFEEIESGKKRDRPALKTALDLCRRRKATLIVAKLDRLARNVAFISSLMEAGVEFVAVDNPNANKLTLHILAAMAEYEREMISERTKAGLKRAKDRGVKLGSPTANEASELGARAASHAAQEFALNLEATIRSIEDTGISSLRGIARALNARGIPTRNGGQWHQGTVGRVIAKYSGKAEEGGKKSTTRMSAFRRPFAYNG